MVRREHLGKLKELLIEGIKTNPGKRDRDCLIGEIIMYFAFQGIQMKRESAQDYIPLIEDSVEIKKGVYYYKF